MYKTRRLCLNPHLMLLSRNQARRPILEIELDHANEQFLRGLRTMYNISMRQLGHTL